MQNKEEKVMQTDPTIKHTTRRPTAPELKAICDFFVNDFIDDERFYGNDMTDDQKLDYYDEIRNNNENNCLCVIELPEPYDYNILLYSMIYKNKTYDILACKTFDVLEQGIDRFILRKKDNNVIPWGLHDDFLLNSFNSFIIPENK